MRERFSTKDIADAVAKKRMLSKSLLRKLNYHFWRQVCQELEAGRNVDIKGIGRIYLTTPGYRKKP